VEKAAEGDVRVIQDEAAVTRSDQVGETFYSAMARAIEALPQQKAPGQQWASILDNLTKKGQVKQEEIDWSGINEWLKEQPGSVAKADLLAELKRNEVVVDDNFATAPKDDPVNKWVIKNKDKIVFFAPKYGVDFGYIEYKGEKVTLDDLEQGTDVISSETAVDAVHLIIHEGGVENYIKKYINAPRNTDYTLPGAENQRELVLSVPTVDPWNTSDETHYGDVAGGRAVVWVRFNDRTDENGNKVLFIEEIQSKRHQEGRGDNYVKKITQLPEGYGVTYNQRTERYQVLFEASGTYLSKDGFTISASTKEEAVESALSVLSQRGVPDAPFKSTISGSSNTLSGWAGLAFKRMLRYAAENGYQSVAWTTGKQQTNRYHGSAEDFLTRLYDENHTQRSW
jgi:hypothetical protein